MGSKLPNLWAATTVGEVYQVIGGGTPATGNPDYWSGDTPWITSADIEGVRQFSVRKYVSEKGIAESTTNKVPAKTLLVVTRVGLGKIAITETPVCFSQDLQGLIQKPDFIHPEFALYLLSYQLQFLKYEGQGTTISGVTKKQLKDLAFPLPPLPEQHRIVAKIDELFSELDKGIENLKTAQTQLKVYRQALLKHAFEGKLTAQWRAENQDKLETADSLLKRIQQERAQRYQQQLADWQTNGGTKPKAPKPLPPLTADELAELPALPEGWEWCKWEDILVSEKGAFKRGPFGSALKKEFFVKSGYKVYEQYCPINDDCSFERYYISDEKFRELEGFSVRAEDFLVSCSGVTLGRITQVPLNFKEGIINQALLRVRVNSAVYDFQFFKTFFRSRYFQKRIFENSTGTAIPNVKGVNELKAIPLPLCSLLEQQQIVLELEARLSEVDQLDQTLSTSLQQSESLRQSILKKAFSGQLVPQDPHDEPASVLLERIKAEREEAPRRKAGSSK